VHEDFQGGGSGVDVACAARGGIMTYRRDAAESVPLDMPRGLHLAVFWSGQPASTAERIRTLSGSLQAGEGRATLDELKHESNELAGRWQSGAAEAVVEQYRRYNAALQAFDEDHDLGIYAAGHAEVAAAAKNIGLVYKPCGAGGGDVGVAVSLNATELASFADEAKKYGFKPLGLVLGAPGLRRDE